MDKKKFRLRQVYAIQNAEFKRRYEELTDKGQSTKDLKTASIKLWLLAYELGAKLDTGAEAIFVDFVYSILKKRDESINRLKIHRTDITYDEMLLLRFIKFHNYCLRQKSIRKNKPLPKKDKSYEAYIEHMVARGSYKKSVGAVKNLEKRYLDKIDDYGNVLVDEIVNPGEDLLD